ncbi:MAG TPA: hypothetical protein VFE19_12105 [Jatrophihabitantaceae bacterium]|nr:hypothetical protein [Jatrophihabitantaceae bacterium]
MTRSRSGPLAAWAAAWFQGEVGPDEVVDAVTLDDAPHEVSGLGLDLVPLRDVLAMWRREAASVRLVLPVAGDVRGVPGPAEFRAAALEAGEAVCGGSLGIVPEVTEYYPSSAPPTVVWRAFVIEASPAEYVQLADVQYELGTAIRETASALTAADVSGGAADIADALHDARRAGEHLNVPPGFPPRAIALLAQAERLQAVLDIAAEDPQGGAVDRFGMSARDGALRPLATAVRRARLAGYNAGSEVHS